MLVTVFAYGYLGIRGGAHASLVIHQEDKKIGMNTYLHGPMDYAKTRRKRFVYHY